jgi:hypothetical protein
MQTNCCASLWSDPKAAEGDESAVYGTGFHRRRDPVISAIIE